MEKKHKLTVVTYADQKLEPSNVLVESCNKLGLKLEVLIHSTWNANSLKIKVLYDFLQTKKTDQIILFVDAFDVLIQENEQTILKKFNSLNTDILFSGEANFSFYDSTLYKEYWRIYPRGETVFDYVNAGSCIGKVSDLRLMLNKMIKDYKIPIEREAELTKIKSDQHFFHRFYVDNFYKSENYLVAKIDRNQLILGCTGGRMTAKTFSEYSKVQSYYRFRIERQILKFLNLHRFQNEPKDYVVEDGAFIQKETQTKPSVVYLPGTWASFDEILDNLLSKNTQNRRKPWKQKLAVFISFISQVVSIIFSLFISLPSVKLQNKEKQRRASVIRDLKN